MEDQYNSMILNLLKTSDHIENDHSHNDWDDLNFERKNMINYPEDFKFYINELGTGILANFIWILNPFSNIERFNLFNFMECKKEDYRTLLKDFGIHFQYKFYPAKDGLIPFGFTDNGDVLYWKYIEKDSKNWSIVIVDAENFEIEEFDMPFSTFIKNILIDKLDSEIITEENIRSKSFKPYKEKITS